MFSINPSKPAPVKFNIDIEGDGTSKTARLVFQTNEGSSVSYDTKINGSSIEFNLPSLSEVYKSFSKECRLEIIVDNYIFTPWKDIVEFINPISVRGTSMVGESITRPVLVSAAATLIQSTKSSEVVNERAEASVKAKSKSHTVGGDIISKTTNKGSGGGKINKLFGKK